MKKWIYILTSEKMFEFNKYDNVIKIIANNEEKGMWLRGRYKFFERVEKTLAWTEEK